MKLLTHLIGTLFGLALMSLALLTVADHTLFSARYLGAEADKIKAYDRLSGLIPQTLAQSDRLDPATVARVQAVITPEVLRTKVGTILDGIEAHYKHGGPVPVIDLHDVVDRARAAGIEIPPGELDRPVTIADKETSGFQQPIALSQRSQIGSIISLLLLGGALLGLCLMTHNFRPFARPLAAAGALVGLVAIALGFGPNLILERTGLAKNPDPYLSIARDLAVRLGSDLALIYGVVAVLLIAGGIGLWWKLHRHEDKPLRPHPLAPQPKLRAKRA